LRFLRETIDYDSVAYTNNFGTSKYSFWYKESSNKRKGLFRLNKIDYYNGDLDMFFEFDMDTSINNNDYLSNDITNIIKFISDSIKKYIYSQNMIKMSDIKNINNDINMENYILFLETKKYNL